MPVISITRLRIRRWRYMPGFFWFAVRSRMQVRRAPGNRGVRLLRESGNVFWTATAWDSEEAVKQYMISGAHARAMPRLIAWCDEASVVRWSQDTADLPTWAEAHRRMLAEGRRSKVHHPSSAHVEFRIPPPVEGARDRYSL
jgi:hypothetical protein